jgi:hypothetical protein
MGYEYRFDVTGVEKAAPFWSCCFFGIEEKDHTGLGTCRSQCAEDEFNSL